MVPRPMMFTFLLWTALPTLIASGHRRPFPKPPVAHSAATPARLSASFPCEGEKDYRVRAHNVKPGLRGHLSTLGCFHLVQNYAPASKKAGSSPSFPRRGVLTVKMGGLACLENLCLSQTQRRVYGFFSAGAPPIMVSSLDFRVLARSALAPMTTSSTFPFLSITIIVG